MNKHNHNSMLVKSLKVSLKSKCSKRQVGAILSTNNNVLVKGYNRNLKELGSCCEELTTNKEIQNECNICDGRGYSKVIAQYTDPEVCKACNGNRYLYKKTYKTFETVLHAEEAVIAKAARKGISCKNQTLYVTFPPCISCSKLIVTSGISKVVYTIPKKDRYIKKYFKGIKLLKKCKVEVTYIKDLYE